MGTRHLIAVQLDGKYKVAQYGQWDGYPSGQGATVLGFLGKYNRKEFEAKVRAAQWITDAEIDKVNDDIKKTGEGWKKKYPELTRDTGAEILQLVNDSPPGIKLKDSLSFATDGLFCEWAYVIDLDKNTLEVFKGFNKKPLKKGERFRGMKPEKDASPKYTAVKLVKSYPLDSLPAQEQFEKDCDPPDEEEGESK